MKVLVYGSVDDWAGIWVDGKILEQNHSIDRMVWLDLLAEGPFEVVDLSYAEWCEEMIENHGHFVGFENEYPPVAR